MGVTRMAKQRNQKENRGDEMEIEILVHRKFRKILEESNERVEDEIVGESSEIVEIMQREIEKRLKEKDREDGKRK